MSDASFQPTLCSPSHSKSGLIEHSEVLLGFVSSLSTEYSSYQLANMFTLFPLRMALHASPPRPSKRPRISHTASPLDLAAESLAAEEELARQRFLSQSKLKSNWERIFAKYSQDFEGIADEIDQATGKIVVDNGHVRSMSDNFEAMEDGDSWDWEEIVEVEGVKGKVKKLKGKKPRLGDGKLFEAKTTTQDDDGWEDTPVVGDCEVCKYRDELDDSTCQSCSLKPSTPSTGGAKAVIPTLILDNVSIQTPNSATLTSTITKSSQRKSSRRSLLNGRDVSTDDTIDNTPTITPAPRTETLPSDAFILEKLGSHGAAVVELLAKARAPDTSPVPTPTQADDTPGKSKTSHIRGSRIEIDTSPQQPRSQPAPPIIPQDQTDIRTWTPTKVTTWLLTHGLLSDEDDIDIARALKKHQVSGAVIVSDGITLDDLKNKLRIESFSKRMQLWSGILKLKVLALSHPSMKSTSPQPTRSTKQPNRSTPTTTIREKDLWAPPPREEDPFYSHIWRDEHPDGTPARFPPRVVDPIFSTPGPSISGSRTTPSSSAKKEKGKKKRKRESLVEEVLPPLDVVESAETPTTETSAVKTLTAETPVVESPPVKGMSMRTPVVKTAAKTPRTKTPILKKYGVNSTIVRTPGKTPSKKITKTPGGPRTPTTKSASKIVVPGWTTGSIGRSRKRIIGKSFLRLGGAEGDDDDELTIDHAKSSPAPTRVVETATLIDLAAQEDGNVAEGAGEGEKMEGVETADEENEKGHKEHKCNGGFCFACLNLEGEEDDLI